MRGIPVSEIYRGTIYRVIVKYRGIPSDGIDDQYPSHQAQFT